MKLKEVKNKQNPVVNHLERILKNLLEKLLRSITQRTLTQKTLRVRFCCEKSAEKISFMVIGGVIGHVL